MPVKAKGSIPPPRTYHTTTVVWKDKLIVFGGGAVGSNPVNDTKVYVFDPGVCVCVCVLCVCVCVCVINMSE